jgi:WD40 repeat protein
MTDIALKIKSVIGFSGQVRDSLSYTPCGKYLVYPLGSFVVIKSTRTGKESFLDGHSRDVSCISLSRDGKWIASGQVNISGVKADVIIWDLTEAKKLNDESQIMIGNRTLIHRIKQHLGKVQDVAFSANSRYFSTLGGQDDNAMVIWDVDSGEALCGAPAAPDSSLCCRWLNNRNDRIITGGNYHVRVWQIDFSLPKLHPMDVKLGSVRRIITSMDITSDDALAYCGTATGDILKIKIDRNEIQGFNDPDTVVPSLASISKEKFSRGVKILVCVVNPDTGNSNVLVGAGDGTMQYVNSQLNVVAGYHTQLMGGITSISRLGGTGSKLMVGTDQCNRYEVSLDLAEAELKTSCHYGSINDIAFPEGCPDLIVTSSKGDIRIWNTKLRQEIIRIQVPNLDCLCSLVTPSGSSIVSGWDDGKIRAFFPESGRIKFVIPDAHADKVTAVAIADNDGRAPYRIVSGGAEGKVRIWNVTSSHRAMLASLSEHRGAVNCIKVNRDSTQCISASADGSCIVWCLVRYVRLMALFESNQFTSVLWHPDESQMLTCGTNHKITYWDAVDGQAIRIIDGSDTDPMSSLDVTPDGEFFVSGSGDKLLKLMHYDDGIPVAVGYGHSGAINALRISPDQKTIVSVGSSGEIIFWDMPPAKQLREVGSY